MSERDLLVRAYDLLSEHGHTTGSFARGSDNKPVLSTSKDAQSFCSLGALYRALADLDQEGLAGYDLGGSSYVRAVKALREAAGLRVAESVVEWNDLVGTAAVLRAFKKAIYGDTPTPPTPPAPRQRHLAYA